MDSLDVAELESMIDSVEYSVSVNDLIRAGRKLEELKNRIREIAEDSIDNSSVAAD